MKKLFFLLPLAALLLAAPTTARADMPAPALYISELMASNKASVPIDGAFPDWAEICNGGDERVDLSGYWLRRGKKAIPLPEMTLEPGACALVPCVDVHLPREGAELWLIDPAGQTLDHVLYENAPTDRSLVRDGEGFAECRWPSPGQPNTPAGCDAFQQTLTGAELVIAEAVSYNRDYAPIDGETLDWVELQNRSNGTLALSDYYLTDNDTECWPLPERALAPGERCVVFCGAGGDLPFGISAGGEELYLVRADGSLCDSLYLHDLPLGGSMGRMEGQGGFFYFAEPTPGEENRNGLRRVSETPQSPEPCGVFEDTDSVTVTLTGPGTIRYTLDGSLPGENAAVYDGPLTFTETTVLRAVCFEDGALPGRSLDLSYILNEGNALPVVSVITDPDNLFSTERGIYANPEQNWEVPASAALFAGERGFEPIECGLKMHGAKSRTNQAKKSFKLCFRDRYDGALACDLFENGVTEFSSVLLRSAWESSISTQMRDILMHELAARCTDSLPTQAYRYCALYLNGEYWGLYALREALSAQHYASHYGYAPESVTMSQGDWADGPEARALLDFIKTHDPRDEEVYAQICRELDIESVIAWSIIESYSGNIDMNSPNMRFYRSDEDGVLRYVLVDLDLGFFDFGEANLSFRTGNPYSEVLLRLMENPDFRRLYLERLSQYLHGPLSDESFRQLAERLADESRPEVERDYLRWGHDPDEWQGELDTYIYGSLNYPGGHAAFLARSARNVFHITQEEWDELFADLE